MNGSPKENENPKIYDVGNKVREFGDSSCIWSAFNSLTTYDNDFQDISTSTNGSIINALRDASESRDRKAISLLLNSGLILSHPGDGSGRFICRFPIQISGFNSTATTARTDEPLEQSGISKEEIFDIIRNIQDPEHPLTLEQLGVVSLNQITMEVSNYDSSLYTLDVRFTPTIPHCSMATLIGLAIRVKLLRSLPNNDRYKVTVRIEPGTHNSEISVNKQLADKERVCAALENKHLLGVVNKCISSGMRS